MPAVIYGAEAGETKKGRNKGTQENTRKYIYRMFKLTLSTVDTGIMMGQNYNR